MDLVTLGVTAALVIVPNAVVVAYGYGKMHSKIKTLVDRHETCPINEVKTAVAVIQRENDIIWKNVSINIGDTIRQCTSPERDELVDKMNHDLASHADLNRLYTLIRNEFVESKRADSVIDGKQVANAILMARIDQKLNRIAEGAKP